MRIGVLLNSDRHPGHLVGIVTAAVAQGHSVSVFAMDTGVLLLRREDVIGLNHLEGVAFSFCSLSAKRLGLDPARLGSGFEEGSQIQNAVMNRDSDRVIVL